MIAANKLEMVCKVSSGNYRVSSDKVTESLIVTGPSLSGDIKIRKFNNY